MGDVKLTSTGGGSVTLTPPSTASNLTVTLPSTSGTLLNTGATSFTFAGAGTISATTTLTLNGGAGSNGLVLDASNNVGIGTSSPGAKLDVKSQINVTNSGGSSMVLAKGTYFGYSSIYGATQIGGTSGNYSTVAIGYDPIVNLSGNFSGNGSEVIFRNGVKFITPNATDTDWYSTLTLKDGNLGLGVTPSAWSGISGKVLEMTNGSFVATAGAFNYSIANAYYNGTNWIYKTTNNATYYAQYNGQHQWFTAPSGTAGNAISFTQAMTLDASGNLLVGVTSTWEANTQGIQASANGTSCLAVNRNTSDGIVVRFGRSSTVVGSVQVTTTATAYVTSSDQRLKTNIAPAGSAIQSILDFPVDQFDWISSGEHQDFGAVAQKAINVIPEMVTIPVDPEEMWGIDWSKAVPRLIKTVQEQQNLIDSLESRLAALEGK